MPKIQCKMCGGMVELADSATVAECPYCGSMATFPRLDGDRKEQLYARAEHFRRLNDFDRALAAYEELVREDGTDADAYWGLVLCRFGIEYVEDPATHERVPTCHRVQYDSILTDADYRAALEHAGAAEREIYEREAKRISEIQKDILALSAQESPFDVFICYKESTDGGTRTRDSALAQDIYYHLTNEGLKVFFARITLEDKLGRQYEPYIFAALNSAKVMLVVGTSRENISAVWVRNEWSRFLALMKKDRSRLLIPCYRDMDAYDLPDELSMFQAQDMSKIGFLQDLIRGVKKVVGKDAPGGGKGTASPASPVDSKVDKLIQRTQIFLQDGVWDKAAQYSSNLLDEAPRNAYGYLYGFMASQRVNDLAQLKNVANPLDACPEIRHALEFSDTSLKAKLQEQIACQARHLEFVRLNKKVRDTENFEQAMEILRKLSAMDDLEDANEAARRVFRIRLNYVANFLELASIADLMEFRRQLDELRRYGDVSTVEAEVLRRLESANAAYEKDFAKLREELQLAAMDVSPGADQLFDSAVKKIQTLAETKFPAAVEFLENEVPAMFQERYGRRFVMMVEKGTVESRNWNRVLHNLRTLRNDLAELDARGFHEAGEYLEKDYPEVCYNRACQAQENGCYSQALRLFDLCPEKKEHCQEQINDCLRGKVKKEFWAIGLASAAGVALVIFLIIFIARHWR